MRSVTLRACTCNMTWPQDIFIKISDCKCTFLYNSLLLLFRRKVSMLCLASFTLHISRFQTMPFERCYILNVSSRWRLSRSCWGCSIHHLYRYRRDFSYLRNALVTSYQLRWIKKIRWVLDILLLNIDDQIIFILAYLRHVTENAHL